LNGHWGAWGLWGACTKTCDEGTHTRSRGCDNPKPLNGGKPCVGKGEQTKPCRIKSCSSNGYDSNFEDGWGIWQQGSNDDFDWERRSTGSPTMWTGPKRDHTTGTGYYVYIEGSPPRRPGQVARLISKELPANFGEHCFTFYYLMSGRHIGYLDLHLVTKDGIKNNLWRKNGHQAPGWINAAVNLGDQDKPFRLIFEAERGVGELSDIALDDIYIDDGVCATAEQGCEDHNPMCLDWSNMGECKHNAPWMNKYCCKACRAIGKCKNKHDRCNEWAMQGECLLNKGWMWAFCCKACSRCVDSNPTCKKWADAGECQKNTKWMEYNCKTSCRVCKKPENDPAKTHRVQHEDSG